MIQLDLKKLSKGMNIRDKMKLLFEDTNRQAETLGKESILTPQERKAIINDARSNGEIFELRKVNELFRTAMFISIDMEITQLNLSLAIGRLEKVLMGILLKGSAEEIVGQMVYDLAVQDRKSSLEIENKIKEVRMKYKVDSILFKGFDFFYPNIDDGDNNQPESNDLAPNKDIQNLFMASFYNARKLKKKLYEMSYVLKKSPIDFLPQSTLNLIKGSEEILTLFTNFDSTLKPLRIYRDFGLRFCSNTNLVQPTFFEIIQDIGKNLELSAEEKEKLEGSIDKSLNEDL